MSFISKVLQSHLLGKIRSTFWWFTVNHRRYRYFTHRYNTTWRNERTVEIPLIYDYVKLYPPKKVLEIGNVLAHYYPIRHTVVDKYEQAPGVINEEIITWHPPQKYDLIVSISTLEHVGWDEVPQNPTKINRSLKRLRSWLTPRGKALITLPLGYNPNLDTLLYDHQLDVDDLFYLKRTSLDNRWQHMTERVLSERPQYNHPFPNANVICVAIVHARPSVPKKG